MFDAGRALVLLSEQRQAAGVEGARGFEVVLLPAHFTPFSTFAALVQDELAKRGRPAVALREQERGAKGRACGGLQGGLIVGAQRA